MNEKFNKIEAMKLQDKRTCTLVECQNLISKYKCLGQLNTSNMSKFFERANRYTKRPVLIIEKIRF